MATLNLPAWGYGLRYRYGLFKQIIAKEGQEEVAEDWLEVWFLAFFLLNPWKCMTYLQYTDAYNQLKTKQKFSPWEIVRHDVLYPIRFFGQVEVNPNGR
jgi:glycogen phosphorylase